MPLIPCRTLGRPPFLSRTSASAVLLLGLVGPAMSSEPLFSSWDFEPGVRLSLFYDDNVRLSSVNPESSFGANAEVFGLFSRLTEVSDLTLRAVLEADYFNDISELNTIDGALEAAYEYRMERATFGLGSSFVYDSTRTSEEETTGLTQLDGRRKFFDVTPSAEYALSERLRIGADFTFQDVSYEDVPQVLLSDYQFTRVGLNGAYDLSEQLTGLARLSYERFDSDFGRGSSDAYVGEAGVRYEISDRMTLTALGGARSVSTTSVTAGRSGDDSDIGPTFALGLDREYGPGSVRVSLERSLLPTGRATLLDTTRARLLVSLPVTERAIARFEAVGVRNREPDGETSANDRDFLLLSPGLEWRLSESTWLDLSYRYRMQDREVLAGDAESNAVFVGFGHDWTVK
jgi:hypothetical protein